LQKDTPDSSSESDQAVPLTPFNRIRKANALTGILANKEFVKMVAAMEEGDYLLNVIAQAVDGALEGMFTNGTAADKQVKEKVSSLAGTVDVAYAKMQAMASSPIQTVLERLLQNLGASMPTPAHPPQENYFADQSQQSGRGEGVMGF
jgi:uncharacterized protein YicC (UPF0701 family)